MIRKSRKTALRLLEKVAEEGGIPRIWMGADPSGEAHLGHASTMLYGFSAAMPLAKETRVEFLLALNDLMVAGPEVGESVASFSSMAGDVSDYLNEKFGPKEPVRIRVYRESEMVSDPEFRKQLGKLDDVFCDLVCDNGHKSRAYPAKFIRKRRHVEYACQKCEERDLPFRKVFDLDDPEDLFSINEYVPLMASRDKFLAPGIHVAGRDWDFFEERVRRHLSGVRVGLLLAPLVSDTSKCKISKSRDNSFLPALGYASLDGLYGILKKEPEEVEYKTWAPLFPAP
jgi:hypothetical protein